MHSVHNTSPSTSSTSSGNTSPIPTPSDVEKVERDAHELILTKVEDFILPHLDYASPCDITPDGRYIYFISDSQEITSVDLLYRKARTHHSHFDKEGSICLDIIVTGERQAIILVEAGDCNKTEVYPVKFNRGCAYFGKPITQVEDSGTCLFKISSDYWALSSIYFHAEESLSIIQIYDVLDNQLFEVLNIPLDEDAGQGTLCAASLMDGELHLQYTNVYVMIDLNNRDARYRSVQHLVKCNYYDNFTVFGHNSTSLITPITEISQRPGGVAHFEVWDFDKRAKKFNFYMARSISLNKREARVFCCRHDNGIVLLVHNADDRNAGADADLTKIRLYHVHLPTHIPTAASTEYTTLLLHGADEVKLHPESIYRPLCITDSMRIQRRGPPELRLRNLQY